MTSTSYPPPSLALLRWQPGTTLARLPCGSCNPLGPGHFCRNFCILHSSFCIRCELPPNQILLSGERSRLAEPWTASTPRSRDNVGSVLSIRQDGAILACGGGE